MWEDRATHYGLFEHADGWRWKEFGHSSPLFPADSGFDPLTTAGFAEIATGGHRLTFQPGTRFVGRSEIDLIGNDGKIETIRMEPLLRFHMTGIGYHHETWGRGFYKGEEAITGEYWNVDDLDPLAMPQQHIQSVVRATAGGRIGHGVLEQAIYGPHDRYDLAGFLNPA